MSVLFVPRDITFDVGSILTHIALEHYSMSQTVLLEFRLGVRFKVAFIEIALESLVGVS